MVVWSLVAELESCLVTGGGGEGQNKVLQCYRPGKYEGFVSFGCYTECYGCYVGVTYITDHGPPDLVRRFECAALMNSEEGKTRRETTAEPFALATPLE